MSPRIRARVRASGTIGLGLLALCALAEDSPAEFRVISVELRQDGRLDKAVVQQCDIARLLTESVQRFRPKKRTKVSTTRELVLRVDRVARVGGTYSGGDFGGTDVAVTLVSAGNRETNQPFFCRANGFKAIRNPSHCDRIDFCGEKIAGQISTWLSWQTAK